MRVAILGASGGVGQELVAQAVAAGHEVTAITRASSRVNLPEGVRHVTADLTDAAALGGAIRGVDVVISALGLRMGGIAPWQRPEVPDFLTRATPALVSAMKAEGIDRVIAVSAAGASESLAVTPLPFRIFLAVSALRHAYRELDEMERVLRGSGLDVCLCRPGGLSNGPKTGLPRLVDRLTGAGTIARADVAAWMIAQLDVKPFAHPAAIIAPG
jgi:putative NADH-flavin reductase